MKKLSLILLTCTLLVLAAACSSEKPESEIEPKEKETITYTDLTQVEFKNIEANLSEDVILLDVRTDSEVAEGMIEGAIQIDYGKITLEMKWLNLIHLKRMWCIAEVEDAPHLLQKL